MSLYDVIRLIIKLRKWTENVVQLEEWLLTAYTKLWVPSSATHKAEHSGKHTYKPSTQAQVETTGTSDLGQPPKGILKKYIEKLTIGV